MSWLQSPILALDTESTGTDPETARVVTYCLGRSDRPGQWEPVESWLIDPGCPIPPEATAVHGITDEQAAEGDTPELALGQLEVELRAAAFAQVPIVLHNAPYDLTLLDREFRRHLGVGIPDGLIILDTLVLFRRFELTTGSRTLGKLAERHGILFPAHDAEADALAALRLLHILCGINELLPWVAQWHNQIDPEYGESVADTIADELTTRLNEYHLTVTELTAWRPDPTRKPRTRKTS